MKPEKIREILSRDGLAEAEKMTGASYKESEFTRSIGMMNFLENVRDRKAVMLATGDTTFHSDLGRYLSIAQQIGFKIVLEIPFVSKHSHDTDHQEKLFILWRPGILLCFNTYLSEKVNGGNFYYNWRPRGEMDSVISSGHVTKEGIWVGSHDCREALVFNISELERHGAILDKWVERPFLWLLHYMDTNGPDGKGLGRGGYDHDVINEARIAMLPEEVRKAITPTA